MEQYEPILDQSLKRFTVFPIQYPKLYELYNKQQSAFWKSAEIDFSKDYDDFLTLTEGEQTFIKHTLAFFAGFDGIINCNLSKRFLNELVPIEATLCYGFQLMMEGEHGITYSLMLDNIIKDPKERENLFNAINTIPTIKKMAEWCFKWIDSDLSFGHRVIAFIVVEGLFFSGAFSSIYWLKEYKRQKMNGLISSNNLIQRDENFHVEFGVCLYHLLNNKLSRETVVDIVKEGLENCKEFTDGALDCRLIGMNKDSMWQYQEYVADRILVDLGYEKAWNSENPFEFMKNIGLQGKTNFFEYRVSEYTSAYSKGRERKDLETLDDF